MKHYESMNNKRLFITILYSGLVAVLNVFFNLVITPYVTERIGSDAYGFVTLANNIVSYATIITLALNSYATRYISVAYLKGDYKNAKRYFNSVLWANILIGIVVLLVFSGITCSIDSFLKIPIALVDDVKVLFVFTFINFTIQTAGSVFSSAGALTNRMDRVAFSKLLAYLLEIITIQILFSNFSAKVWLVGVAYIVYALTISISYFRIYLISKLKIHINISEFSFAAVKELVINGMWNSINSIGNTLNTGLDLIIADLMLDATTMGELAIAKTFASISGGIFPMVTQAFQPILLKDYAEDDNQKLVLDLKLSMKLCGIIAGLFFCGFVSLGEEFYSLWIPNQNIHLIYNLTVITLLSSVMEGVVGPLYYIYTLTVKNKIPCFVTIIGGVFNVIGMFFLIKYTSLGVYAVVITTAVVMNIINLVTNPLYMCRCLKIKWSTFYPTIIRYTIYIILCVVLMKLLNIISINGWITFSFQVIIDSIAGAILYFIVVMDKKECKKIFFKNSK